MCEIEMNALVRELNLFISPYIKLPNLPKYVHYTAQRYCY
jgi:hypothetical protein